MYLLMAREFAFILITAGLIAYPAGYLFAHTTPGAYKYQMVFGDYALAIAVLVATALSATGYHATRAVLANPVETLRYE
jgi:ABC-type lipoprotein release transport system permease subunit